MKRDWKPGDVAMRIGLSDRYVAVRVPKCTSPSSTADAPHWHFATASSGVAAQCGSDRFAEYRPVVVIDPEDDEQVKRLLARFVEAVDASFTPAHPQGWSVPSMQAALRSLIEPPKPEEPTGLGAVVEDARGTLWVRVPVDGNTVTTEWISYHSTCRTWDAIAAVRVLSDGVQP